jgi:hypothetical protein
MIGAMAGTDAGESKAWELLAASSPAEVCARAAVAFDRESGAYRVPSFGRRLSVGTLDRLILGLGPGREDFLERHAALFRLSVLWYLAKASRTCPSGTLVKPSGLPGGEIFLKGTHVLPLDALAAKYATRPEAFLDAGTALGGRRVPHGDAAIELPALPKIPTTVILWTADEEFPARADLLFDRTAPRHLPTDVLWSVAMLSVLLFLEPAACGFLPRPLP